MTTFQSLMLLLSLGFGLYVVWPVLSASGGKLIALARSAFPGDSETNAIQNVGTTVTAEQAQAAQLVMARFLAQSKEGPERELICNGIKTLAEQIK